MLSMPETHFYKVHSSLFYYLMTPRCADICDNEITFSLIPQFIYIL